MNIWYPPWGTYFFFILYDTVDRNVPLRFGGIEFNTGGLNSILEGQMLVVGSMGGAGVEFNLRS